MEELKVYDIYCVIETKTFKAKNQEEAEELFKDSISDEYGVFSAIKTLTIHPSKQTKLIEKNHKIGGKK